MRLFLVMAIMAAGLFANAKPTGEKKLRQLKAEVDSASDPARKFNAESSIARLYSSKPLTKENIDDARKSADSLLVTASSFKDNWDYGNAIHHAHLVLGRVSLFEGKVDEAKRQLKLAAQTPGSPQLNSFGPNMTLAKELLEKGEKSVVSEYFDDCAKFWNDEHAKSTIAEWKAAIAKGKTPSFGGHLVY